MNAMRLAWIAPFCLLVAVVAACSAEPETQSTPSEAVSESTSPGAEVAQEQTVGLSSGGEGYWEAETLEALDRLLISADGYAFYYMLDPIVSGMEFTGAYLDEYGDCISLHWESDEGQRITVFALYGGSPVDASKWDMAEIVVDGRTYYYSDGLATYFMWVEDETVVMNVHPGEAITPEVIRKYGQVRKVEFNAGMTHVGFGSTIPLVASTDKARAIVGDIPGVKFHMGASTDPGPCQ